VADGRELLVGDLLGLRRLVFDVQAHDDEGSSFTCPAAFKSSRHF
jgi:hypothetical protein